MTPSPPIPFARLLGDDKGQRKRVSQVLLAVPALLLMHLLLLVLWRTGQVAGEPVAWFVAVTLGCAVAFYALARLRLGARLSREASLSAPQMLFAMGCVAWVYALAGSFRTVVLCLMPLILCFGAFELRPRSARGLSHFGIVLMGVEMVWLVLTQPRDHEPAHELAHWVFVAASMAMIQILSDRLGHMRARLSAQKAELSEALARIQLLATRDVLTGLLNRRAAQDELRRAVGLAARSHRPLVLALADLDHFKLVNDSFGHQAGDRVLQAFARAAEGELRGADLVARWGGEEFLFVLPDTDDGQARVCLDRLHAVFSALQVGGVSTDHALSFSAGVALCAGADDIESAIDRADRAMYSAKLAGRSRTHPLLSVAG